MSGSTYGTIFRITTWGESHGAGVGVVVDGCPAGLSLTEADIQVFLDRRKPGTSRYSTPRKEGDQVEILSGVFEGKTTGTPISLLVRNTSQRSADYSEIASYYRPGHADMTYDMKYGFRDYRGGGRSSGRETIGRVAAGAIAVKILNSLGIQLFTYTRSIGPVKIHPERFQIEETSLNPLCMPDAAAAQEASEYLDGLMKEGDSAGGVIECIIRGMKPGVGDPAFEKLNANLGKAILSIGAVKGFEIGDGFAVARARGSQNNDPYAYTSDEPSKSWPIIPAASWAASATAAISFSGLPSSPRPPSPWNRIQSTRAVKISSFGSKAVTTRSSFRELLSWWKPWPPSRFSICFLQASRPVWTI